MYIVTDAVVCPDDTQSWKVSSLYATNASLSFVIASSVAVFPTTATFSSGSVDAEGTDPLEVADLGAPRPRLTAMPRGGISLDR